MSAPNGFVVMIVIGLVAAALSACGDDQVEPDRLLLADGLTEPLRGAGLLRPCILWPRHRIPSGAPRTVFVAPGQRGPITVVWWRSSDGSTRRATTTERRLPWPKAWPPLREREWLEVIVLTPGGRDRALAHAAAPPLHVERTSGNRETAQAYAHGGWPLLAALAGLHAVPPPRLASWQRRADLPRPGLWRARHAGGSLSPAQEPLDDG